MTTEDAAAVLTFEDRPLDDTIWHGNMSRDTYTSTFGLGEEEMKTLWVLMIVDKLPIGDDYNPDTFWNAVKLALTWGCEYCEGRAPKCQPDTEMPAV